MANDPDVSRTQRDATRKNLVPRLETEIGDLTKAVDAAVATQAAAHEQARLRLEQARGGADRLPPPARVDDPGLDWLGEASKYEKVAAWATRALGMATPPWPADPAGEPARLVAVALGDVDERSKSARHEERVKLAQALGDVRKADAEVIAAARSVAGLRASGLLLTERTLQDLGTPADDPVFRRLGELQSAAEETKKFMEQYDRALDVFGDILGTFTKDAKGKALLAETRERVGLIGETMGRLGELGAKVAELKTIHDQLGDDRTVLQGMAGVLGLAKEGADSIPLAGPLIAQTLGVYAKKMGEIGAEAVRIQTAVIAQDVAFLSSQAPPERHLYTSADLGSLRIGNEAAVDRTKRMLQVRRLLALVGATDVSTARDLPMRRG